MYHKLKIWLIKIPRRKPLNMVWIGHKTIQWVKWGGSTMSILLFRLALTKNIKLLYGKIWKCGYDYHRELSRSYHSIFFKHGKFALFHPC